MTSIDEKTAPSVAYWIGAEKLSRSWHPAFFSGEFRELDHLFESGELRYRQLGDYASLLRAPTRELSETNAEWIIRFRHGAVVVEPVSEASSREKMQEVPGEALIMGSLLSDQVPVFYWDESTYQGKAVTPISNLIIVPLGDVSIAWLAGELTSRESYTQLRRITIGLTVPRLVAQELFELKIPVRSAKEMSELSQRIIQANVRNAAFSRTRQSIQAKRADIRPLLLTGATFEERIKQFEHYLDEQQAISASRSVFFVEAATNDQQSDLFVVRPIGIRVNDDEEVFSSQLEPQEDLEVAKNWRAWYWSTDLGDRFSVFNSLIESPVLPAFLLVRTTADPLSHRLPFTGRRRLPGFVDVRSVIEANRISGTLDIEGATDDLAITWERINSLSESTQALTDWLRRVYRPLAAVKVLRDSRVAGVYLIFGEDQLNNPVSVRETLEALGAALSELLQQPSEIIDEGARRESIRRLSWMMHQINGPLMRIRGVLDDLTEFIQARPDIGTDLIPDAEAARLMASMNQNPIESYSIGHRLEVMAGAVDEIRALQEQIRRLKNSKKELEIESVDIAELLRNIGLMAQNELLGLVCDVVCDNGLDVNIDKSTIEAALSEVIANSIREFRQRHTGSPRIIINIKVEKRKYVLEIKDNALPADIDLIDNPFTEDATTYAQQGQGTGLGLAIVQETIQRHGGRCKLYANIDEQGIRTPGITFSAELPLLKNKVE